MRKLWIRIGLGAAVVFVSGMFVVTLARQMKNAVTSAIRDGGHISVPLSILPFELDGSRLGSVREIDVERNEPGQVKWIRVTVKLKGDVAPGLRDGAITLGQGRSLFDWIPLAEAESRGMVTIGEVRFEPSGMVRPIMLDADHATEWFDRSAGGDLRFRAGAEGANLQSVRAIGAALYTTHAFAFEATSVLILVAMVGAVVLARRQPRS